MKLIFDLCAFVLLMLVVGTAYNLATGNLEFFVAKDRYKNALVCKTANNPPADADKGKNGVKAPDGGDNGSTPPNPTDPPDPPDPKPPPFPLIQFEEVLEYWRDGFLFVDARRTKRYAEGHIPGAVCISAWEPGIEEKVAQLPETEPLEAPVVVYCTASKDCEDSHIVADHLKTVGYLDVKIFEGGFPEWKKKGKQITTGEEPGSRPQ